MPVCGDVEAPNIPSAARKPYKRESFKPAPRITVLVMAVSAGHQTWLLQMQEAVRMARPADGGNLASPLSLGLSVSASFARFGSIHVLYSPRQVLKNVFQISRFYQVKPSLKICLKLIPLIMQNLSREEAQTFVEDLREENGGLTPEVEAHLAAKIPSALRTLKKIRVTLANAIKMYSPYPPRESG